MAKNTVNKSISVRDNEKETTKDVRIEEIDNGYILVLRTSKYTEKEGYKEVEKKVYSKENPLDKDPTMTSIKSFLGVEMLT